jgi:hypothetical protein
VEDNLVAKGSGMLSPEEQYGLIDYIDPTFNFATWAKGNFFTALWDKAQDIALKALAGEELAALKGSPGLGALLDLSSLAFAPKEERAVLALFFTKTKLVDSGLGTIPPEAPHAYAATRFVDGFVGRPIGATIPVPIVGGVSLTVATVRGLVWDFANKLETLSKNGLLAGSMPFSLRVYEVSYCDPTGDCSLSRGGIKAYLAFRLTAERRVGGGTTTTFFDESLVEPYDARAWPKAQNLPFNTT